MSVTTADDLFWCERAWLNGTVEPGVTVRAEGGRITSVRTAVSSPPPGSTVLHGLTVPGLANAHSHAFHRVLRGSVQAGSGTFWTWREQMYAVAARLTPDTYFTLARAVYAEMALAGITCVGEFHYVHHQPDGTPYGEPNAMGEALIAAAGEAGIRITLLDTCYVSAGFGEPPEPHQLRFTDGDSVAWAARADGLGAITRDRDHVRTGAAIHSVRAVPADQFAAVVRWAEERQAPLHVHLSEQTAENEACVLTHGVTPTRLLAEHGALGPRTTAVHATHLTPEDMALLGSTGTTVLHVSHHRTGPCRRHWPGGSTRG